MATPNWGTPTVKFLGAGDSVRASPLESGILGVFYAHGIHENLFGLAVGCLVPLVSFQPMVPKLNLLSASL